MSLDMIGHIDDVFQSVAATRYRNFETRGSDGRISSVLADSSDHTVNIQPLSEKEIDNLGIGADRILDYRKIYVNDGAEYDFLTTDTWRFWSNELTGEVFTVIKMDNRPWRNYCKIMVARND